MTPDLAARTTRGAEVALLDGHTWRLSLPSGPAGAYRWAQLDDYLSLRRAEFRWRPPLRLSLTARISAPTLPGTWGFGLWNDPFSVSSGLGGAARRLPTLPNAAWFFYASKPNHLALWDDHPAAGFLAATFASSRLPPWLMASGLPTLPTLLWAPSARLARRLLQYWVRDAATQLGVDPTDWRTYTLEWAWDGVRFTLDGNLSWETPIAPHGPLGLVLWIDNQYAAFPPAGKLRFGTLASQAPAWLELADIDVASG